MLVGEIDGNEVGKEDGDELCIADGDKLGVLVGLLDGSEDSIDCITHSFKPWSSV